MKISICDKCKGFNYKEVKKTLEKEFVNLEFQIGCNNLCGIGRNKISLLINEKLITADNIDDLINKTKKMN